MTAAEETRATDAVHRGCGGVVLVSLDGEICARCRAELREEDWLELGTPPPGATLDELRAYAERVSQESGMATVIVAHGGDHREYVVTSEALSRYTEPVSGALVEALRQRQELLGEESATEAGLRRDGAGLIAAERERQVTEEGWTAGHDAEHGEGVLARAGACYAWYAAMGYRLTPLTSWPWDEQWWKPGDDPVRTLVKAGALIAAEIDRLSAAAEDPQ
jgi:hypothetical protein